MTSEPFLACEFGTLYLGDSLDVMITLDTNSIDAIVTDPPYGLTNARPQVFKSIRDPSVNKGAKGFMGLAWDHGVPSAEYWLEVWRIAKPGAHMLAFGGTRTFHRLTCEIEDAGWDIRDVIMWVYGSGFPKSLDIGKAIDRESGEEREITGTRRGHTGMQGGNFANPLSRGAHNSGTVIQRDQPVTDGAKQWDGWGTALKPAWEPIIVARKPVEGTVAANVLKHGTGAIDIDGCRIGVGGDKSVCNAPPGPNYKNRVYGRGMGGGPTDNSKGRWPANLIHDGSDEVTELFPESKSCDTPSDAVSESLYRPGQEAYQAQGPIYPGDSGSAARFYYCAKAAPSERGDTNTHPTVKPQALMRYLCKLVTPPGGTVLDPFMGSGSTCLAAKEEGFKFTGIDKTPEYCEIAKQRLIVSEGIFGL